MLFDVVSTECEADNKRIVAAAEDMLFTTFTKELADKVRLSPRYINAQAAEWNTRLWKLAKFFFLRWNEENKDCRFEIDEAAQTITATDYSVYDHIIYDSSTIEKPFAVALDNDPDVKMFFKLPDRFKIDTPIGAYNPDWAVYLMKNGEEKLYFVIETKGSESEDLLRPNESKKIRCGKKHFEALNTGSELRVATNWNELKAKL